MPVRCPCYSVMVEAAPFVCFYALDNFRGLSVAGLPTLKSEQALQTSSAPPLPQLAGVFSWRPCWHFTCSGP